MSTLTLFVLCHNRPDFARQTLRSVLDQSDSDFELIVSDNSSNDEVERMVAGEFPGVLYRRRVPMLEPLAHFNRCIDEVQTDYFCLFHDDDLMHRDFVMQMRAALDTHPQAVACGCNALIESFGKIEARTAFRALGRLETIESPRDLARRYFARSQSGFAPFPCYLYRRRLVDGNHLPITGGKYADVIWLLDLAKQGKLVWINTPLMTYRIHGGSDGIFESPRDRLRLLRYIKQNLKILGADLLADYRCSFIYKPLSKREAAPLMRRQLAQAFLKRYSWSRYTNPSLYSALLKRLLVKLAVE